LVAELSHPVFGEPNAAPAKRNVTLRFDAALLTNVDAAQAAGDHPNSLAALRGF
jgi:hypothetical protein